MSTDTVFSVGSEDCRFVCCILPTAFVTVLSWVEEGHLNPRGLPRNKKKLFVVACTLLHTHASLEGLSCLPPGTLRGSICDRVFL